MGLRFRRSLKIAPGIKINVTKTGLGVTAGVRGAHYSVHSSGRRTGTIGLPGTGLYRQSISGGTSRTRAQPQGREASAPARTIDVASVLPRPGFLAPAVEKAYHAGLLAYLRGDLPASLAAFEQVVAHDPTLTSANLFAGLAAIAGDDEPRAIAHLEAVLGAAHALPDRYQAKYLSDQRLALALTVKITEAISASAPFSELGATLTLAELYQGAGRLSEAIGIVQQVHEVLPDPLITLSLCDLLLADHDNEGVVEASAGVTNDGDVGAETLHLRGAAMMALGHGAAAIDVFRAALTRTAGRDPGLLNAIRYDRGIAYDQLGQHGRARADFEKVYAMDPAFEDIKERLAAPAS